MLPPSRAYAPLSSSPRQAAVSGRTAFKRRQRNFIQPSKGAGVTRRQSKTPKLMTHIPYFQSTEPKDMFFFRLEAYRWLLAFMPGLQFECATLNHFQVDCRVSPASISLCVCHSAAIIPLCSGALGEIVRAFQAAALQLPLSNEQ